MKITAITFAGIIALAVATHAAEFHVAPSGKDSSAGSQAAPLRTIQRAADLAQPGDVITVHRAFTANASPRRAGANPTPSASSTRPHRVRRSRSRGRKSSRTG